MNSPAQDELTSDFPPRLSPAQAQEFLGVSARQLKGLRERRAIRYYRLGRRTLAYDRSSLAALLVAGTIEALPATRSRP